MAFQAQITKRVRQRKLRSGEIVAQTRYVLNYRDPRTGQRHQNFFERQKEAQAKLSELAVAIEMNTYASNAKAITVGELMVAWLATREGVIKAVTFEGYQQTCKLIVGPLLEGGGTVRQRHAWRGETPEGAKFYPLLGKLKLTDLTTAMIRAWHKLIVEQAGTYSAGRAKMFLKAALAFGEEEYSVRAPVMPKIGRGKGKAKKVVLQPEDVARLIAAAKEDPERGIYYAFPFLAGTRPSEQLGLRWEDIDFERNLIRICGMQERNGVRSDVTKTDAGMRELPMSGMMREMLLAWRVRCPRKDGQLDRVFPAPGVPRAWPLPRAGGGGPLLYNNYRVRYWVPALKGLGLPYVTPHSARHAFISTLQAQGIEVGLVAKLAGHKNATVTLSHYTQAMRGGEAAVEALDRAYAPKSA